MLTRHGLTADSESAQQDLERLAELYALFTSLKPERGFSESARASCEARTKKKTDRREV